MICAIAMNVAIDKAYVVKKNEPGQVMRVLECSYTPGGKGLNVARVARAMGEDVVAGGLIGGHAGAWVEEALRAQDVACDFERCAGETRSCVNIIEQDGRQTEFLEPGFCVTEDELRGFEARFRALAARARVVTISGSVPRGVDEGLYPRMIEACRALGVPVLLDASGGLLKAGASARPTLIKPNAEEIVQLLGAQALPAGGDPIACAAEAARALRGRGIRVAVLSLGARGAVMACPEGVFHAAPPKVRVQSATGCGDSMLAGFAIGFARGMPMPEALRCATALAAANAMELGTGCVDPARVPGLCREVALRALV